LLSRRWRDTISLTNMSVVSMPMPMTRAMRRTMAWGPFFAGAAASSLRSRCCSTPMFTGHGDARRVDDIGLNAPLSKPARQPKSVTPRFIGDDYAFDRMPSPKSLITPSVHELQQLVLVGVQFLQRLALDARDHSRDKPNRLAHLDDDDKRGILVQGCEGSAEIVRLQHGALHRIVKQRRKCHTFAARPIPSSRQNPPHRSWRRR
jgi:hypothetical protein